MHTETGRAGRPRSEEARAAVLHAVDDLLAEVGYAAMTMKGIAERAGVGRQTVYRWWSTKAEILFEAVGYDAPQELAVTPSGSPERDLTAYVHRLLRFLTGSDAGTAYRALLGEAQHDPAVATLLASRDVVSESAHAVVAGALPGLRRQKRADAVALLVGAPCFAVLSGHPASSVPVRLVVASVLALG